MLTRAAMRIISRTFLGVFFFAFCLFPAAASADSGAEDRVVFGVSLDLSGPFRVMSDMQAKGFRLWETHVNERGGVLGRKVRVVIRDNQGNPEKLRAHYLDMLENSSADFVFSPYSSAQNMEVVQLFEDFGTPVVASGASAPVFWERGYRYFFGLYSPADNYVQGFLEIMSLRNMSRLAVFYLDDPFSSSAAMGAAKWAARLGMDVRVYEPVGDDPDSYLRAVEMAHKADVQVLIMCGYLDSSVLMRRAMASFGPGIGAYFATVGPVSREYYHLLQGKGENTFSAAIWKYSPQLVYPGIHRFNAEFTARFGHEPNYHAATAYAAGQLMDKALERAGNMDRQEVRDVLAGMETFTVIGRYGVNDHGKQVRHLPFTIQWQQGEMEIVWPLSLATARPRIEYERR